MRKTLLLAALTSCALPSFSQDGAPPSLTVLYVQDGTSATRAKAFGVFLAERFARVTVTDHEGLEPALVAAADVVILDWSQVRGDMPPKTSPLGKRDDLRRPTVMLGSAGLHHSCAWGVAGGSG